MAHPRKRAVEIDASKIRDVETYQFAPYLDPMLQRDSEAECTNAWTLIVWVDMQAQNEEGCGDPGYRWC